MQTRSQGLVAAVKRLFRMDSGAAYKTAGWGPRSTRWRGSGIGPNAAVQQVGPVRNQARELVRKNPIAAAGIKRLTSSIIGTGIRPQWPTPEADALWLRWTDEADAYGTLDFYGVQDQVMAAVATAGECFVRLRARLASDGLSVPLQLEVLESEYVPLELNEVLSNGNIVRMGVEFDANVRSRRVAYWMYKQHPTDGITVLSDAMPVRVPASEILHVFVPTRPGQVRGEPWLHTIIDKVKDLGDYDSAEIVRKKTATLFAGFIVQNMPSDVTMDDLKEIWGADVQDGGDGIADVGLEPGVMQYLRPGEQVEFSDPKDVGAMYEVFMRVQHRTIASALGILYEQMTGDYSNVNDRTWRAAMNDFKRRVEQWQHQLVVFQFCRPVAKRWIELATLTGALKSLDPARTVPEWMPQRWPYINPVQDVTAQEREVLAGFTSRTRVVSERGDSVDAIDAEIAKDNKRAHDLMLSTDGTVQNVVPSAAVDGPLNPEQGGTGARAHDPRQPIGIVLPEKMLTVDVARPTFTEVEARDPKTGRILSLLVKPANGIGPTLRRKAIHDANGRLTGHEDEVIEEKIHG